MILITCFGKVRFSTLILNSLTQIELKYAVFIVHKIMFSNH